MQKPGQWRKYAILVPIGLFLALGRVWTRLQVTQAGYALANAQQLLRTLEGERQALEAKWSAQTAPSRLTQRAAQVGLEAPHPEQVVLLP
jgi:hypothetical protein